jgi:hypothetical protein
MGGGGTGGGLPLGSVHGGHGGVGSGAAGLSSSREGSLYVTARAVGFSTMLGGDLKGITDVTHHIKLKVRCGEGEGRGRVSCRGLSCPLLLSTAVPRLWLRLRLWWWSFAFSWTCSFSL